MATRVQIWQSKILLNEQLTEYGLHNNARVAIRRTFGITCDPIYWHDTYLNTIWMSNYIHRFLWDVLIDAWNLRALYLIVVDVRAWMKIISQFYVGVIFHPCTKPSLTHWGREKNDRRFSYDIFKRTFLNKNAWISIKISLKFVPKGGSRESMYTQLNDN